MKTPVKSMTLKKLNIKKDPSSPISLPLSSVPYEVLLVTQDTMNNMCLIIYDIATSITMTFDNKLANLHTSIISNISTTVTEKVSEEICTNRNSFTN